MPAVRVAGVGTDGIHATHGGVSVDAILSEKQVETDAMAAMLAAQLFGGNKNEIDFWVKAAVAGPGHGIPFQVPLKPGTYFVSVEYPLDSLIIVPGAERQERALF
ncbi:MAG: hypothetical protein NTY19_37265 [Planctomycetota bacterium]|nr:hypothetical protein [Planctomycetota bacterium]